MVTDKNVYLVTLHFKKMLLKVFGKATAEERQDGPSSQGQSPPPPAPPAEGKVCMDNIQFILLPRYPGTVLVLTREESYDHTGYILSNIFVTSLRPAIRDLQSPQKLTGRGGCCTARAPGHGGTSLVTWMNSD